MNCRVCGQWNQSDVVRCVFCDNLLEGGEDATGHGKASYVAQDDIELVRLSAGEGPNGERPSPPEFAVSFKRIELIVTGIAIILVIVLSVLFRC